MLRTKFETDIRGRLGMHSTIRWKMKRKYCKHTTIARFTKEHFVFCFDGFVTLASRMPPVIMIRDMFDSCKNYMVCILK